MRHSSFFSQKPKLPPRLSDFIQLLQFEELSNSTISRVSTKSVTRDHAIKRTPDRMFTKMKKTKFLRQVPQEQTALFTRIRSLSSFQIKDQQSFLSFNVFNRLVVFWLDVA